MIWQTLQIEKERSIRIFIVFIFKINKSILWYFEKIKSESIYSFLGLEQVKQFIMLSKWFARDTRELSAAKIEEMHQHSALQLEWSMVLERSHWLSTWSWTPTSLLYSSYLFCYLHWMMPEERGGRGPHKWWRCLRDVCISLSLSREEWGGKGHSGHLLLRAQSACFDTLCTWQSPCLVCTAVLLNSNSVHSNSEVGLLSTQNNPQIHTVCIVESANQSSASQTIKSLE